MNKLRKNVYMSLLVAIGLILSIVESSLPSLVALAPGIKLGFSNIVVVTALVLLGFKDSLIISLLKSLLLVVATGNVSGLLYGLPAGLISCLVMNLAYRIFLERLDFLSLVGVSILGSISHNFIQLSVAVLIMKNVNIYIYLPYMSILSLFTGYFIGMVAYYVTENLKINIEINGGQNE